MLITRVFCNMVFQSQETIQVGMSRKPMLVAKTPLKKWMMMQRKQWLRYNRKVTGT